MEIQIQNLSEAVAQEKPRKLRVFLNFLLFFCLLAVSLSGGSFFAEYTQALQTEAQEIVVAPSFQIYEGVYANFGEDYEEAMLVASIAAEETLHLAAPPLPEIHAEKKVGVYLHMNNTANPKVFNAEIEKLKEFKNTALIFDVKGSYVYFPTNSEMAKKYGLIRPLYELPEIISQLKSEGIYTIARVITIKDSEFSWKNKNVKLWNSKTGGVAIEWVDPSHQEVLDYNREIIGEVLEAGIDEINLDFIRYPTKFMSSFLGITAEEKIKNISNFIKMVREVVDEKNPRAILSVNTFAILAWDYQQNVDAIGQDIKAFAADVDIIAPMLYPNTFGHNLRYYNSRTDSGSREYNIVKKSVEKYRELLGEDAHKLRPWIQGYYTTKKNMVDQIQGVYDGGACGFTIWDIYNNYKASYEGMREVEVPSECS